MVATACMVQTPAPAAEKACCSKASLAVWGVQSPMVAGQAFSVSVRAKSLDGFPLGTVRVVLLDENGVQVGSAELAADGLVAEGTVNAVAPAAAGPVFWRAALMAGETPVALRPLPFSITPTPSRPVRLRVIDAATEQPLGDASVYLYHRNLAKVRPLHAVSNMEGLVDTYIVEDAPYNVRIECRGYREGICNLDAGGASTLAEGTVRLVADVSDELSF